MNEHTVDIGHVHVLTEHGGPCVATCPHPDHGVPDIIDALLAPFKQAKASRANGEVDDVNDGST